MSKLTFAERAWDEYIYWQMNDKKTLKRINLILKDISRNGNDGIGKPEPLRYRDGWSRRIDDVNRLVISLNRTVLLMFCNVRVITTINYNQNYFPKL